jgi:hypothetical protein
MQTGIMYDFDAEIWKYSAASSWYFVAIPNHISLEIKENLKWQEEGWGRMKAKAKVGSTTWDTAIWYDSKRSACLLPIKSSIRKIEKIDAGFQIAVTIWV